MFNKYSSNSVRYLESILDYDIEFENVTFSTDCAALSSRYKLLSTRLKIGVIYLVRCINSMPSIGGGSAMNTRNIHHIGLRRGSMDARLYDLEILPFNLSIFNEAYVYITNIVCY